MNKKVISDFQKMIDVNTPIIYINDYDFVRIDEIIVEIVGNSKVFEWNPATGTTNFKTKESQGLGENDTLEQFLRDKYTCLLYTSPSPRDISGSRMPSSA